MADGRVVIDVILNDGQVVKGVANLNNSMKGMGGTARSAAASIAKIATAVGAVYLLKKGFDMVKSSIGQAFGRIDTMEQFKRVMTTMTGSSEKANEVLATTNDIVTGTSYGLDVGAKAVQNFVTSNMKVDKATQTVAAWGDAVSFYGDGSNETFNSVTTALAQMTAKGKVQMDTMNSLTEAGIPAMQIYADATGQSVADVAKQMEKGQLDAGEFVDVMNKAIADGTKNFAGIKGAAKEAGASWGGTFANMRAAVARGVTSIIESIDLMLTSNGLPDMRALIAKFGKAFETVLKSMAASIPQAVEFIQKLIDKFKSVKEALEPWMPLITATVAGIAAFGATIAIMAGVAKAFMLVQKGIAAVRFAFFALQYVLMTNPFALIVAAAVFAVILIIKYWEPIKAFFIKLWEYIKVAGIAVWEALKVAWSATVEFLKALWEGIVSFFVAIWEGIKAGALFLWDAVVTAWNAYVERVKAQWQVLTGFFASIWEAIKAGAMFVWEAIVAAWTAYYNVLVTIWTPIIEFFLNIWEGIKAGAIQVWEVVVAAWTAAVAIVQGIWTPLAEFFASLWTNITTTATTIWGAISEYLSTLWSSIQTIASAAWEIIKNAILGPILLLIELVKGDMEGFKAHLMQIWTNIQSAAQTIWNAMKDVIQAAVRAVVTIARALWDGFKSYIQSLWNAIKSIATNVWNAIKTFLQTVTKAIVDQLKKNWETAKSNAQTIFNAIKSLITTIWNGIKTFFSTVIKAIVNQVKSDWNALKAGTQAVFNAIKSFITTVWNGIKTAVSNAAKAIVNFVKSSWNSLRSNTTSSMNGIKSTISSIWNGIKTFFTTTLSNIVSTVRQKFADMINAIKGKMNEVKSSIESGWKQAQSFLKGINLAAIGRDIIQGLINGIKSKIGDLKAAIKGAADAITGKIKSILNIHSPSRVMIAIGQFIGDGLVIGMRNTIPANKKTMEQLGNVLVKSANNTAKQVKDVQKEANKSIAKEKKDLATKLSELDKKTAQSAKKAQQSLASTKASAQRQVKNAGKKTKGKAQANADYKIQQATKKNQSTLNKIYSDAEAKKKSLIKASNEKVVKITKKSQSDVLKIQGKSQKEKLDSVKLFVEDKQSLDQLTLEDEVAIWGKTVKQFKKGTKERVEAQKNYNKAVENLDTARMDKEKSFVDERKKLNQLSLYDELKLYEAYSKNYKKGTDQRQYWDEQALDAKKRISEAMISVNEDYTKKMQEINQKLIDDEKKLNEEYQKALDDRTKSLYSFAGIFDEIKEKEDVSGDQLIKNLQDQVSTFKDWSVSIEELAKKGIDEGLLEELREMGPKAAAEIAALNALSDKQLGEYASLWREKSNLARSQAINELGGMRQDTAKQIEELRLQSNIQLEQLKNEWTAKITEIRYGTKNEFNPMTSDLNQIGKNSMKGIIAGLESMEGALLSKARSIADSVKQVMAKALDIHSPSRWMRDMIGKNMIKGWVIGIDSGKDSLLKKAEQMAGWMKPDVPVVNRLRGVTAPIGNVRPIRAISTSGSEPVSHDNSKTFAPQITNHFTPEESTPSESARKQQQLLRRLATEF